MPEKKIFVRAWYWTGPPNNRRTRADFIFDKIRRVDFGIFGSCVNAWGVDDERFIPNRDIEEIWEEEQA